MRNIKLFMFIIPLLAGLLFADPLSINAAYDYPPIKFKYSHYGTVYDYTLSYTYGELNNNRYAVFVTYDGSYDKQFLLCATTANYNNLSTSTGATLNFSTNNPFGLNAVQYRLFLQNTLLDTNLPIFADLTSLNKYLNTGIIENPVDVNGNPIILVVHKTVPVKYIRFLRYENTGSAFFLQKEGYAIAEEPNIEYQFAGNFRYKYFPRSVLQDIITHYGWTDEQSIYDYFIENEQFIYETDYNYFMQQILIPNRVYDLAHYMYGNADEYMSGYAFSGYKVNNGNILQYIYSDYNDMSDLEVTLATFTMYPIAWQNALLPFDTITFEWDVSDILNVVGDGSTITQPDWQIPEPEDGSGITNIEYTHSNDDYMGRTSDILNAYYYDLPLNMISESTGFLTYVFEAIPKPIKIIYAFIIIVGCVVGVVCIARE